MSGLQDDRDGMETLVRDWADHLGLGRWDITVWWGDDIHPYDRGKGFDKWDHSNAHCFLARDYEILRIYLNPDFITWDEKKRHIVVVHELLHAVMRPMERIVVTITDTNMLHRDVVSVIENEFDHQVESVIDQLAYRIVGLADVA